MISVTENPSGKTYEALLDFLFETYVSNKKSSKASYVFPDGFSVTEIILFTSIKFIYKKKVCLKTYLQIVDEPFF